MSKTAKRLILYIGGIFILAIGINISKMAGLGISPISSIPYTWELIFGIELGKATTIVYLFLMALQIILLRKNYKIKNLLQILSTYVLSVFITYTSSNYLLFWLSKPNFYILQLIYLMISIIIIGVGVSMLLIPNVMPMPAEGLCQAIVILSKDKIKFSTAKIIVDSSMVLISAILSIIFLGGLKSVREGTILAALMVGKIVGFIFKRYKENVLNWINKSEVTNII
jgi:uncharacterized membrane protein YczE